MHWWILLINLFFFLSHRCAGFSTQKYSGATKNTGNAAFHCCLNAEYIMCAQSCPTLCSPMDCQAPLSMEFPRQKYWSGLPFPSEGDLPDPGIEPKSPVSPAPTGRFFTIEAPGILRWPCGRWCEPIFSFLEWKFKEK